MNEMSNEFNKLNKGLLALSRRQAGILAAIINSSRVEVTARMIIIESSTGLLLLCCIEFGTLYFWIILWVIFELKIGIPQDSETPIFCLFCFTLKFSLLL
jgi:hypothetical protein